MRSNGWASFVKIRFDHSLLHSSLEIAVFRLSSSMPASFRVGLYRHCYDSPLLLSKR